MYKEFTDEIVGYMISDINNAKEVQAILTQYLINYELLDEDEDRDMTKEGLTFAKGSAFYDVFVRNGRLEELYSPIYATISLSKSFMKELGFKTTKDDGVYGEAIDIRTNGMTVSNWNREGHSCTYFGETLKPNISIQIRKDSGSRTVFNGYIFYQDKLKDLLELTW